MLDILIYLRLGIGLIFLWSVGFYLLTMFQRYLPQLSSTNKIALSFGLGGGVIFFQFQSLAFLQFPVTFRVIATPWILVLLLSTLISILLHDQSNGSLPRRPQTPQIINMLSFLATTCLVFPILLASTIRPIFSWDSWAIWDIKARALFYSSGIAPLFTDPYYGNTHLDYPILYPVLGGFIYLSTGQIGPFPQTLSILFTLSALILVFGWLRSENMSGPLSIMLTTLIALAPNVMAWGLQFQAEAPLVFYTVSSIFIFQYGIRCRLPVAMVLSGVFAGFLASTKIEGLLLAIPIVLAASLLLTTTVFPMRRTVRPFLAGVPLFLFMIIYLPWLIFTKTHLGDYGTLGAQSLVNILAHVSRLGDVFGAIYSWVSLGGYGPHSVLLVSGLLFIVSRKLQSFRSINSLEGQTLLVAFTLWSFIPYILFLISEPQWLVPDWMGRYFVVPSTLVLLSASIVAFRSRGYSPKQMQCLPLSLTSTDWTKSFMYSIIGLVILCIPSVLQVNASRRIDVSPLTGLQATNTNGTEILGIDGSDGVVIRSRDNTSSISVLASLKEAVDGSLNRALAISYSARSGAIASTECDAPVYWRSKEEPFSEQRRLNAAFTVDGEQHILFLRPGWTGNIDQVRLDLCATNADIQKIEWAISHIGSERRVISDLRAIAEIAWAKSVWVVLLALAICLGTRSVKSRLPVELVVVTAVFLCWLIGSINDLLPGGQPEFLQSFHSRLFEPWANASYVLGTESKEDFASRVKRSDVTGGRPAFAALMGFLQTRMDAEENVLVLADDSLWDNYETQRSYYLLYPRKVYRTDRTDISSVLSENASVSVLAVLGDRGAIAVPSGWESVPGGNQVFRRVR